jgi:hypothetical protein
VSGFVGECRDLGLALPRGDRGAGHELIRRPHQPADLHRRTGHGKASCQTEKQENIAAHKVHQD